MPTNDPAHSLRDLTAQHDFLIGIDSDGCAFDTMEIKHKECFCPNTVKHWGLQPVSRFAREAAEFVNLYSQWRGINRWPALVMVLDLLRERPAVQARHAAIPPVPRIRAFIADEAYPKSNDGLRAYMADHPDPELDRAMAWSLAVNAAITDMVYGIPPFPYVRESLEYLHDRADMLVVSQTPTEALEREWSEHGIDRHVRVIAGQEMGKKSEHLALAAKGQYPPDRILMIGDAPGDLKAARANHARFYPINPGREAESWQRFREEAVDRFLAGDYAGDYEATLIAEFEKLLPGVPPWKGS
ncbi:MAG: HAD hydrolase-like protein [Chloroflexi bacterium]|nr:HAD hydrolase-like protein [Chloroflexota bacterium]MBU1750959.1 HAD hydrolase-like protein [Chloroflexota bacterium]MBU1878298.1 HAD hydrolase-like protein [Chloroflexota bacterium]